MREEMGDLRFRLKMDEGDLKEVNDFLLRKDNPLVNGILEVIDRYGGVAEINRRATEAGKVENLMDRLRRVHSPFVEGIEWLTKQRDANSFISIPQYRE